jgi:hypothetical protein
MTPIFPHAQTNAHTASNRLLTISFLWKQNAQAAQHSTATASFCKYPLTDMWINMNIYKTASLFQQHELHITSCSGINYIIIIVVVIMFLFATMCTLALEHTQPPYQMDTMAYFLGGEYSQSMKHTTHFFHL